MKFEVINLGCKVNACETEGIARKLAEEGYERAEESDRADITVIFTCAVTNTAAAKSRKVIHRARRENPNGIIAVAGCYAQIDPETLKEADILVGSKHKPMLADYISRVIETGQKISDISDLADVTFEPLPVDQYANRTRAFLKIQDGCNQFCTYCVIPYARGKERSMDPDMVIEEARTIAKSHKEIVLAGIHTGRYGKEYGITLAAILKRILQEVPQLERLRISSIEVTELDDEFTQLFIHEPRIARHLHIPLQSGSDTVLQRMGRPYDTAAFLKKITEIRQAVPDVSISTDLMTGFPGETDEEFEDTCAFLKQCEFSFLHVFPYSERNGTVAAARKDQVDPPVRKRRAKECIKLSDALYDAYKDKMIGRQVDVLMETEMSGHTSEYMEVILDRPYERNTFVKARIVKRIGHDVYAEGCDEA